MTADMPRWSLGLITLLALPGCAAASPPSDSPAPLIGSYRVAAVDGRAPEFVEEDAGKPRTPRFAFGQRSYSGTSGCNFLGGLKVQRGARLFTYPGAQTQMGCGGALGEQERTIDALFRAAPTIAHQGDAVMLTGAGHTIMLETESASSPPQDAPEAWQGSGVSSQRFELRMVDGAWRQSRQPVILAFSGGRLTVTADCGSPMRGSYQESGFALTITGLAAACPADRRLAAVLAGDLATVSGPNGELLIAGTGGWAALDNARRDRPK